MKYAFIALIACYFLVYACSPNNTEKAAESHETATVQDTLAVENSEPVTAEEEVAVEEVIVEETVVEETASNWDSIAQSAGNNVKSLMAGKAPCLASTYAKNPVADEQQQQAASPPCSKPCSGNKIPTNQPCPGLRAAQPVPVQLPAQADRGQEVNVAVEKLVNATNNMVLVTRQMIDATQQLYDATQYAEPTAQEMQQQQTTQDVATSVEEAVIATELVIEATEALQQ